MANTIKIFAVAGSLREGSFNKATLRVAEQVAPEGVEIDVYDRLGELPLFNQDHENNPPEVVQDLKQRIRNADAILFVTAEYNYSVPGVLKNMIDIASRPYGDSAWEGKPVGIMSASGSMLGGARAQYHLRQMCVWLNMFPLNTPEVMIPAAYEKFDEQGNITDQKTKDKIQEMMSALLHWTQKLNK